MKQKATRKKNSIFTEEKAAAIAFLMMIIIVAVFLFPSYTRFNVTSKQIKTEKINFEYIGNEFGLPFGISVDKEKGIIYISDLLFNNINEIELSANPTRKSKLIKAWGVYGNKNGQFDEPSGVDLDKDNNVYVCDAVNGRIQKFNSDGKYLMQINYSTNGFWRPRNVLVSPNGDIYVANTGKSNIYRFNSSGFMVSDYAKLNGEVFGLAMDKKGQLYTADVGSRSIVVLSPDLKILKKHKVAAWRNVEGAMPMLAIDSKERIYAVASNEQKIVVYDTTNPEFKCIGEIKYDNNKKLIFDNPLGIAIDSKDYLYITERNLNKVLIL